MRATIFGLLFLISTALISQENYPQDAFRSPLDIDWYITLVTVTDDSFTKPFDSHWSTNKIPSSKL